MTEERRENDVVVFQKLGELSANTAENMRAVAALRGDVSRLLRDTPTQEDLGRLATTLQKFSEEARADHNRLADILLGHDGAEEGIVPRVRSLEDTRRRLRAWFAGLGTIAVAWPPSFAALWDLWKGWRGH